MEMPFRYMPIDEVCAVRGQCSHSKQWDDVRNRRFPPPDKVGHRSLWRSDVVAKWLLEQARLAEQNREAQARAGTERANRLVRARQRDGRRAA